MWRAASGPGRPSAPFTNYSTWRVCASFDLLRVSLALVGDVDDPMRGCGTGAVSGSGSMASCTTLGLATGGPGSPGTPCANMTILSVRNTHDHTCMAELLLIIIVVNFR